MVKLWTEVHLVLHYWVQLLRWRIRWHYSSSSPLLFRRPECLRSHSVLSFENLIMKFGGVLYLVVISSKSLLLLVLELWVEICACLSGGRSAASHVKGQRLRPTIEDGQVLSLQWNLKRLWEILLAFQRAIIRCIWSIYEWVVSVGVKEGLLPPLLEAETLSGYKRWTES